MLEGCVFFFGEKEWKGQMYVNVVNFVSIH